MQSKKYDMYLTSHYGTLRFPIAPKYVKIDSEKHYETADIQSRGEIDYLTTAKRIDIIDVEVLIPASWNPACLYSPIPDQREFVQTLKEINKGNWPSRLIITELPYNASVNLANVVIEEAYSDRGDKRAFLTFREITGTGGFYGKQTIERPRGPSNKPRLKDNRAPLERPKTYYIKGADELWSLAKRIYGDGREYNRILAANGVRSPYDLRNGQKIILP